MSHIAVVTPSYRPDLERCELLAEGIARFASSDYRHVVIVPHRDRNVFVGRLRRYDVTVILQEDLLPSWLIHLPFSQKWQVSPCGWPVRGWVRQQVVKIAYASLSTADALLFADSDICFVKSFDSTLVIRPDGRVRLLSEPGVGNQDPHHEWYRRSSRLLDIPVKDYYGNGFIGGLEGWVPAHARTLVDRIETVTRKKWKTVLLHQKTMSEFILYGLYVQEVLGIPASRHFVDERPNPVHQHYIGALTDQLLLEFIGGLAGHHVAILVQSKVAYPFALHAKTIRGLWQTSSG